MKLPTSFFLRGGQRDRLNKSFLKKIEKDEGTVVQLWKFVVFFVVFTEASPFAGKDVFETAIQKLSGMWHHVDMEKI